MKRRTLIILAILVPLLAAGGWAAKKKLSAPKEEGPKPVAVTRGELTDKAMAIGTIEPRVEVGVKSILAGVVRKRYAEVGDYVKKGAPLLEISPNPTPLELIELRRSIEMRQIELKNLQKDLERQTELKKQNLNSDTDVELAQRRVDESTVQLSLSQERLALQENGKIVGGDNAVETVIRSPIDGFVLEDSIEIGDPVVPLTPYQEGTVLMRMAAMKDLIFRGTVDEIDVGRLTEGMPVVIKIGALPDAQVTGKLSKIWLKARKQEQATVFPIEIQLVEVKGTTLRAGYSANAEVIIARRDSVLLIPERLITQRNDSSFVQVKQADGTGAERYVKTGLSDAINVEVLQGLSEGELVMEKPPKEIT
jgi:HlyD family secretion protein